MPSTTSLLSNFYLKPKVSLFKILVMGLAFFVDPLSSKSNYSYMNLNQEDDKNFLSPTVFKDNLESMPWPFYPSVNVTIVNNSDKSIEFNSFGEGYLGCMYNSTQVDTPVLWFPMDTSIASKQLQNITLFVNPTFKGHCVMSICLGINAASCSKEDRGGALYTGVEIANMDVIKQAITFFGSNPLLTKAPLETDELRTSSQNVDDSQQLFIIDNSLKI